MNICVFSCGHRRQVTQSENLNPHRSRLSVPVGPKSRRGSILRQKMDMERPSHLMLILPESGAKAKIKLNWNTVSSSSSVRNPSLWSYIFCERVQPFSLKYFRLFLPLVTGYSDMYGHRGSGALRDNALPRHILWGKPLNISRRLPLD